MNRLYALLFSGLLAMGAGGAEAATWSASYSGADIVPATASTASGLISLSLTGDTLTVDIAFSGLVGGGDVASLLHCCIAPGSNVGVAMFFSGNGFPLNVTSGTYHQTFDLTQTVSFNSAYITANGGTAAGAEAALTSGLNSGMAYATIHNATFPGGEIRANLTATVPEAATWALMIASFGALGFAKRRRLASA
jgi:hypothetical protein